MATISPKDRYGRFVCDRLVKGGHAVYTSNSNRPNDPLTALINALIDGLEGLVSRIVDRVLAKVNRWQERREQQRIVRRHEQYRRKRRRQKQSKD